MGTQWAGMGRSLMQLPDFRDSILRSDAALKETGLVVSRLLMEAQEDTFEDTVHAFVGLAAVQVQRCCFTERKGKHFNTRLFSKLRVEHRSMCTTQFIEDVSTNIYL